MIMQDVMITYSRKTQLYKFYADGRQVEIKGGMAYHQICLLLLNATQEDDHDYNSKKNIAMGVTKQTLHQK